MNITRKQAIELCTNDGIWHADLWWEVIDLFQNGDDMCLFLENEYGRRLGVIASQGLEYDTVPWSQIQPR